MFEFFSVYLNKKILTLKASYSSLLCVRYSFNHQSCNSSVNALNCKEVGTSCIEQSKNVQLSERNCRSIRDYQRADFHMSHQTFATTVTLSNNANRCYNRKMEVTKIVLAIEFLSVRFLNSGCILIESFGFDCLSIANLTHYMSLKKH